MQDKIISLLKIKIDAINRNIDNLNYLNGELEKNNESLEYIRSKIFLFEEDSVLNFDKIDKSDFERILLMIDSNVSEIFKDKTCNYQGIMYIIQGIRQGISLELTTEQTNAIISFKEGMLEKEKNLIEVIEDLSESKERLPENDLGILTSDLKKYQDILFKLDENLYLTEIDDIVETLEFSNVSLEERNEIFEYILKYNADIYAAQKPVFEEKEEEITSLDEIKVPEFHFEPIEIKEENEATDKKEEDLVNLNDYDTFQMPIIDATDFEIPSFLEKNENINIPIEIEESENRENIELENKEDENINIIVPEFANIEENVNSETNLEESEESTLNTVDLEDIIKKIDAKLKEMEQEETNNVIPEIEEEQNEEIVNNEINENEFNNQKNIEISPVFPEITNEEVDTDNINLENDLLNETEDDGIIKDTDTDTVLKEVLAKYDLTNLLSDIKDTGKEIDAFELDSILNLLKENKIIELVNDKVLVSILTNNNKESLNELLNLVKENFLSRNKTYEYVIKIVSEAMPLLLMSPEVINTFKTNIEFFKENKINLIHLFDNYRELLIIENEDLKSNLEKVKKYNLELNNDNVKYLLYNKKNIENLDYYIEAYGYEKGFLGSKDEFDGIEYIKKHPYKLNFVNQNTLMKLRYSTENDMKIYGSKPGILAGEIANPKVDLLVLPPEYKNLYFNHEYSFYDRSEMLSLLNELKKDNSFDLTMDENLEKLDSKYKKDEFRYKIENILFSRIKTIRLYNILKKKGIDSKNALVIALTYNSVIKRDEFVNVENFVNNLVLGGN